MRLLFSSSCSCNWRLGENILWCWVVAQEDAQNLFTWKWLYILVVRWKRSDWSHPAIVVAVLALQPAPEWITQKSNGRGHFSPFHVHHSQNSSQCDKQCCVTTSFCLDCKRFKYLCTCRRKWHFLPNYDIHRVYAQTLMSINSSGNESWNADTSLKCCPLKYPCKTLIWVVHRNDLVQIYICTVCQMVHKFSATLFLVGLLKCRQNDLKIRATRNVADLLLSVSKNILVLYCWMQNLPAKCHITLLQILVTQTGFWIFYCSSQAHSWSVRDSMVKLAGWCEVVCCILGSVQE